MNFCCERFQSNYQSGKVYDGDNLIKELFPNIKIVKLKPDKINEGKDLYRYLYVCGFLKDKPPVINMRFCPFCGTNLYDFYTSDEYINESSRTFW